MSSTPKEVRIVCAAKKAVVTPPYRDVPRGGTIQFHAVNSSVTLFFPKPDLFSPPVQTLPIARNNSAALNVSIEATLGLHPYAAFCSEINEFAEGGSPPMMIIE
ncbi:MAG: hypothetical protein FJ215_12395 [Ignavibacteria bacterium]|nr:hypothetical protein [Ignavibacteria bacterium]